MRRNYNSGETEILATCANQPPGTTPPWPGSMQLFQLRTGEWAGGGARATPPIAPFAISDFRKKHRIPSESPHTRALEAWKAMGENHKLPSKADLGIQARIA